MRDGLAVALLAVAVTGAVTRPWRIPAWAAPAAAAVVALVTGTVHLHQARIVFRPLAAPLAFVALAVPLAVMLDDVGIFEELARRAARSSKVVGACWLLAAGVVALLNLDAAVVLLTPLYIRTARRVDLDPVMLAFQPVLLAMFASGVLPVSNLTNLIAASRFSLTTTNFITHLAVPSIAASTAGWVVYRRVFPARATILERAGETDQRALVVGGSAIIVFLVVLVGGEHLGIAPWMAALGGVGYLALFTRTVPWRHVPVGTVTLAAALAALAVLAGGVAAAFPHAFGSAGAGGLRGFGTGMVAGDVLNNLPAALVTLPQVSHVIRVWPLLFGLNIGPSLVITGSLAGLLWQASMHASGVRVSAGQYSRVGAIVGVPAMAVGVAVLLVLR